MQYRVWERGGCRERTSISRRSTLKRVLFGDHLEHLLALPFLLALWLAQ